MAVGLVRSWILLVDLLNLGQFLIGASAHDLNDRSLISSQSLDSSSKGGGHLFHGALGDGEDHLLQLPSQLTLQIILQHPTEHLLETLLDLRHLLVVSGAYDFDDGVLISAQSLHGISQSLAVLLTVKVTSSNHRRLRMLSGHLDLR